MPDLLQEIEYSDQEARVMLQLLMQYLETFHIDQTIEMPNGIQCVVTYSLKRGLAKFGDAGKASVLKEMKQLHDCKCWEPISKEDLNSTEIKRALESLIFLVAKRDGEVKTRHCADGSTQREYMSREDTASPTVSTKATMLTA